MACCIVLFYVATYPTYDESWKDYFNGKTMVHMLIVWSESADTHLMLEIHAYGARKQPTNT